MVHKAKSRTPPPPLTPKSVTGEAATEAKAGRRALRCKTCLELRSARKTQGARSHIAHTARFLHGAEKDHRDRPVDRSMRMGRGPLSLLTISPSLR